MGNKELGIADPVYDALRIRSGQSIAPDLGSGIPPSGGAGLENKIYLWHTDGSAIDTFDPDATGLGLALVGAVSGDLVWCPQITIACTTGITIPAGVTLRHALLSFSGFSGAAITLSTSSVLLDCAISFDGTGQATAIGVYANAIDSWGVNNCSVYVHSATTNNYGMQVNSSTSLGRGSIEKCDVRTGGANAVGYKLGDYGSIRYGSARCDGTDGTSCGVSIESANAKAAFLDYLAVTIGDYACRVTGSNVTGKANHCTFIGAVTGLIVAATCTLVVADVYWSTLSNSGTLIYQQGSRGNYSVEDFHAADIEAAALTRHLPKPAVDGSDNAKTVVVSGTNWILGDPSANQPIVVDYSTVNVSNPPTQNEISSAFGLPSIVGAGFVGMLNDNTLGLNEYLCASDGYNWWYLNLTKAQADTIADLTILAADTFTGADTTHLNVHTMDTGSGWTENSGSWTIASNAAGQATTGSTYIVSTDVGAADLHLFVRIKTSAASGSFEGGLIFRMSDASNYWRVTVNTFSHTVYLQEINGGSGTTRDSKSKADRFQEYIDIEINCSGNSITATVDGGYTLSYTSSFNNTATRAGLTETRTTGFGANVFDNFQVLAASDHGMTRVGTVLSASQAHDDTHLIEPSVIFEGNPIILAGNVFKMWYLAGWDNPTISYAESTDGVTWTKYGSNPILTDFNNAVVIKVGGAYWMYGNVVSTNQPRLYTSSDGITWTLDTADFIALGGAGAWDDYYFGNYFVWQESPTVWYMLYEARRSGGVWKIGLASSSDGRSWTKSGSNPVISEDTSRGGPWVQKIGSTYYLWLHKSGDDFLPGYLARYASTNLTTWTPWPRAALVSRIGLDEGEDTMVGGNGDVFIVDHGGTAYVFYAGSSDGTAKTGNAHIKLITAPNTIIGGW